MKKFLCAVLSVMLVLSAAACGQTDAPPAAAEAGTPSGAGTSAAGGIDFNEPPYELTVCYIVTGQESVDMPRIVERVNALALKEINATIKLEPVSISSQASTYALKASSQEKVDLMLLVPGGTYLTEYANSNMIQPIDEAVAQWGQAISEAIGDTLDTGKFKGRQYTIPEPDLWLNCYGFQFRVDLLEKYGYTVSDIKSIADIDALFEKVHAGEPDIFIIMPETPGGNMATIMAGSADGLGVGPGILDQETGHVVMQEETEAFKEALRVVRGWYEKGYISRDVNTLQERAVNLLVENKCFSSTVGGVNPAGGLTTPFHGQFATLQNQMPLLTTSSQQLFMWAVPSHAARPDKSVQFLNFLFASTEAANLFRFGIEGEHYTVEPDGSVMNNISPNYLMQWNCWGDSSKYPPQVPNVKAVDPNATIADYQARLDKWQEGITVSKAFGFTFDPESVKTEIAACTAVQNEFLSMLGNGALDPEIELPNYVRKLKDAGAEKVIAEKQRQLDEFLSAGGGTSGQN
ncbi:MAG: ABC transporter substrate-binding protein [Clostridiales bacterium]|nr:ABC transporter substrate-binding protein [Clostridiales bacterium]